ncbi:hypothetical protein LX32DRAFT_646557 [Colletotrichum zoysiae]|uniref:Uncharacterized protein n=1 Tax=Colletotrichum zoysiae TaxID=1216348 RepID=A0AAD9LWX3_9PEZI|nr:hypothetical protein LX32DRAFT_646557 [Colletotrichum zoysiae]
MPHDCQPYFAQHTSQRCPPARPSTLWLISWRKSTGFPSRRALSIFHVGVSRQRNGPRGERSGALNFPPWHRPARRKLRRRSKSSATGPGAAVVPWALGEEWNPTFHRCAALASLP